ncbi:MAG TPA: hypothetical protein VFH43_11635, partial [Candidatus Kapabacteria bacterium]|nr:hypothetical protein [Candidatus Kapabacteria bacterium]
MLDETTTATVRGSTSQVEVNLSDDRLDLYERLMLAFEYRRAELIPLVDRAVEEANDNRGRAVAAEGLIRRAEFHGLRGEIEKGDADLVHAEEMIEQASSTDPISVRLRALLLSGKAHYLYENGKPHESTEASYRALELGEQ